MTAMWHGTVVVGRSLRRDRLGVAALEFSLVAGVLVALLLGVFDIGSAVQQNIRLAEAVRAGGQFAISFPTLLDAGGACPVTSGDSPAAPTSAACAITQALPASWSDVTINVSCQCANNGSALNSPSPCTSTSQCDPSANERYVTLQVTRPFAGILPPAAYDFTSITSNTASYVVRVQ